MELRLPVNIRQPAACGLHHTSERTQGGQGNTHTNTYEERERERDLNPQIVQDMWLYPTKPGASRWCHLPFFSKRSGCLRRNKKQDTIEDAGGQMPPHTHSLHPPGSQTARLVVVSTCTERILRKEIISALSHSENPAEGATCCVLRDSTRLQISR